MNTNIITDRVITVDYRLPLQDLIAAGNYDWKSDDVTERKFSVPGHGIVEFEAMLVHFGSAVSSRTAVESIACNASWEPAKIEHLLAFGAKYPGEQRKYPIIGLGSVAEVDGVRSAPCLHHSGAESGLGLAWWDSGWRGYYRFLAVRRLSSAV